MLATQSRLPHSDGKTSGPRSRHERARSTLRQECVYQHGRSAAGDHALKILTLAAVAVLSAGAATVPAHATDIIYAGSQSEYGLTANYTITTDGALGYLSAKDLVDYSVTITNVSGYLPRGSDSLNESNSSFVNPGELDFTSSSIKLAPGNQGGNAYFEGRYSGGIFVYPDTTYFLEYVEDGQSEVATGFGNLTFASAVSAAPEPSTWALMIAAVAMIGGILRFGRRRASIATA